ncbi:MAG: precorrin-3B C(17)-methyltransferase [Rikenellaceae bacterium]
MKSGNIVVVGIGPGDVAEITPEVMAVLQQAEVIIGYKHYFQFIASSIAATTECIDTGMKQERARAEMAFELAEEGKRVAVISSGDSGIYGMAPLIMEMKCELGSGVEVTVLPGISAFQKAASLLGAPVGHDFCVVSLSDLMTPWELIERRITAAASADFVTAIYNPKSHGRYWQLYRLCEIFMQHRSEDTPVGYVRNAGREGEQVITTTLGAFDPEQIDMFTVVIIGNQNTFVTADNKMVTPRGYYRDGVDKHSTGVGQQIMIKSFKTIESELRNRDIPLDRKWALLHAIHTTADFDMESILYTDEGAVEQISQAFKSGKLKTIITDVTMAQAGIRKAAAERLGLEVKCYLHDPRVAELAAKHKITRTQAGVRLAVEEHPDALYVFGNAPTALMELCALMRKGVASPEGIIAAPVGFVNVRESKYMVKSFKSVRKVIVEGRKGGSNLAATLVNSILSLDDAEQMRPGKDV